MSSAPSLHDLQRRFAAAVVPPAEPASAASDPLPLNPQRGVPGQARLAVYADGYLARLHEALAEVYEATRHVLGAPLFLELAHAYAAHHASADYNLSFAGRHLPDYLATWPHTAHLPFLPDLAHLEWRICEAFHAHEQPPWDSSTANLPSPEAWAGATLVFQPSVSVSASAWPILDLWQARMQPRETVDIDLVNRPQQVAVFRAGDRVQAELLTPLQHALLESLLRGETFEQMCAALAERIGDAPPPIGEWLGRWIRQGLVVEIQSHAKC